MPDWLKALIAGFTARKLGGGCLSTVLIFILVFYALGHCGHSVQSHANKNNKETKTTLAASNQMKK